ncbi:MULTISPECIES: dTDP-4-dehydrorhamnose reductase [Ferrimicrobium]|uniref:dTDP-4-dehydrorhamnose reductase n=1 Tax=Ferrimicrobium acidiphilum TaxID=121039 RepID=A0ABV3Y3N8_9ACTN|nr:dTDP-4-dehydrorhamnose reductase [Ferrimicrobium sp.]MCL5972821.1 dTDP-4-dehydrorhamnose reductase [Actinomycetota bacterium]
MTHPRFLVLGANGQLGQRLTRRLGGLDLPVEVFAFTSSEVDIGQRSIVNEAIRSLRPDWVVNAAAFTAVDRCELEPDHAFRINALAVRWIVEAAAAVSGRVCNFSTDYVFDGHAAQPYREWDRVNPLGIYGRSKLGGEQELRAGFDLNIRTAWLMSASRGNIASTVVRLAREGAPLRFVGDQVGSPTVADDLSEAAVQLMLSSCTGCFHVVNGGVGSWYQVVQWILRLLGRDPGQVTEIEAISVADRYPAPRPSYSVLSTSSYVAATGRTTDDWHDALERIVRDLDHP